MHTLSIDRPNNLIEMRLEGFITAADADKAAEDLRAAIRSLGVRIGTHLTLYDVMNVQVAPGDTIALMQGLFVDPRYVKLRAYKVAFASSSALGRLQLRRLQQVRSDIGVFEDVETARKWLLAGAKVIPAPGTSAMPGANGSPPRAA